MNAAAVVQIQLLEQVKLKLAPGASLPEELATLLNISTDSAYRRIRGEKLLTLDETLLLCRHFQLSMDVLMGVQPNVFSFTGEFVDRDNFHFDRYLSHVVQQVKYMNSFDRRKMTYLCKDIPLFHHFQFREIAAFKYYFWMKNILYHPDFQRKKFKLDDYPDSFFELGKQSLHYYNRLDSVEVWNIESINSTIRQVEFYRESNLFSNQAELLVLYEALEKLVSHIEMQATHGRKFDVGSGPEDGKGQYQVYFNEIVILENSILVELDQIKAAYLVHNVINFMITRDVRFCEHMQHYVQNLIRKSTLISTVSERERARFFKFLRQRIRHRMENIKA